MVSSANLSSVCFPVLHLVNSPFFKPLRLVPMQRLPDMLKLHHHQIKIYLSSASVSIFKILVSKISHQNLTTWQTARSFISKKSKIYHQLWYKDIHVFSQNTSKQSIFCSYVKLLKRVTYLLHQIPDYNIDISTGIMGNEYLFSTCTFDHASTSISNKLHIFNYQKVLSNSSKLLLII